MAVITPADIANIIYAECHTFGIKRYPDGKTHKGEVSNEFIVIHSKRQLEGDKWDSSIVEVNFFLPNLPSGDANTIRIEEIERQAKSFFVKYRTGLFDGIRYRYYRESMGREYDEELRCHYVNVRLIFETINVK
ncbi:hypothetical protein ACFX5L_09055 [Bacteroides sp. KG123]|uniref:hypothetical protein n=1 Tax=unclassified Bacteroides TaxID=2646097 RepID=UPI003D7F9AE7